MNRKSSIQPIISLLALALLTGLAGCESNNNVTGPDNVDEGRFEATILFDDGNEQTLEGRATFASATDTSSAFVLGFLGDDPRNRIGLLRWKIERPETGTHDIVPYLEGLTREAPVTAFWGTLSMTSNQATSESGTLTITSSSSDVITGTLEFTARGGFGVGEKTFTVSASFQAVCAPVVQQDCD